MADNGASNSQRMWCSIPEKFQLHAAMLALQFGYAGFHVVSRAALNMGVSKLVFPVYRNVIALLLLLPFAYFLEKYVLNNMITHLLLQFIVCILFLVFVLLNFVNSTISSTNCFLCGFISHFSIRKKRPAINLSFLVQFFLLALVGYVDEHRLVIITA